MLFCCLSALAGFLLFRLTYVPAYTSDTIFVVSNKTGGVLSESESLTLSDISASAALANTFKYILLSDDTMQSIMETYGLDLSLSSLKNCVDIIPVSNTNLLEMKVVTHSAVLSRDISAKIIECYPEVLERTIKYASLEVLNSPRIAQAADSNRGNITYPVFGLLGALFISVLFVYLKLLFRDTVKTVSDLRDRLKMNILVSVPKLISLNNRRKAREGLYITDKSNGFTFIESYKALRTKIEMIAEKKRHKTFVVTSALESEGKTTAAVNLSVALAANGKMVLLIDADLRKPSSYKIIGKSSTAPEAGIDQVLRGTAALEDAIVNVKELGISMLPCMNEFTNPSELLSSSQMKDLISRVSGQYDYVIIDASPASVVTDSVVITTYTDAVILTIRQDYAPVPLIASTVQSLSENKAEFIGCIFNMVDDLGFEYEKYSRRSYNYGKEEKYGRKREDENAVRSVEW